MNKDNKVIGREIYRYKKREFVILTLEKKEGYGVFVMDPKKEEVVDCGFCSYVEYAKICKRDPSKDPVREIIDILKESMALWVDKGLV